MLDATRGERETDREMGRESSREEGREGGELLRARGKHLKLLRAMLIQRVRRTLSRIAMFYIIIPAAIRGRSAHRKTLRMERAQWNCHNTLWIIIGRGYNPRPLMRADAEMLDDPADLQGGEGEAGMVSILFRAAISMSKKAAEKCYPGWCI